MSIGPLTKIARSNKDLAKTSNQGRLRGTRRLGASALQVRSQIAWRSMAATSRSMSGRMPTTSLTSHQMEAISVRSCFLGEAANWLHSLISINQGSAVQACLTH